MLTRRRALQVLGAATLAGPVAAACSTDAPAAAPATVPFHGAHQAGIATPAQDRLVFAAFDLTAQAVGDVRDLLRAWTAAAAEMAAGRMLGAADEPELAPPADTGEAAGLSPARLTVTVGFGPSLFTRLGLEAKRPAALVDLPAFPGDALQPARSGGDLCVQACADDPQVAFHAVRNLARIGRGAAVLRWSQLGFGRTSSTATSQATARNLMGFKDGTRNVHGDDAAAMRDHVWVGDGDQAWMRGGTYMVTRRIRMRIESWDRTSLREQEQTFGRVKSSGAPLGGRAEHDTPDLSARGADGLPLIATDAHIRLAAPATNSGVRLLRRGYSYTDGIDPVTTELDAGLFFIAFQRDVRTGFIPVQRRLAQEDSLNEYIRHTGSGMFACPPGVGTGGYWGSGLLG